MKAEIKTTTEKVMREVEETRETVHLELSIQEAHLIESLLTFTNDDVSSEFGIGQRDLADAWWALHRAIRPVDHRVRLKIRLSDE